MAMFTRSFWPRLCAGLLFTANAIAAPLHSNHVLANRDVFLVLNLRLDPDDLTSLVPVSSLHAEGHSGMPGVMVDINVVHPTMVLEDSAFPTSIKCSPHLNTLELNTDHPLAMSAMAAWPQTEFILVTNANSCASSQTGRGVYLIAPPTQESPFRDVSRHTYGAQAKGWRLLAPGMHTRYDTRALEAATAPMQQKRWSEGDSPACAPVAAGNHYCNIRGTLSKPAHQTIAIRSDSFLACQQSCEASETCLSFGWDSTSRTCTGSTRTLQELGVTQVSRQGNAHDPDKSY